MKRTWPVLLVLLLLAAPAAVQAQYSYSINASNANTITITGYAGPGGAVTIPTNINHLLVTSISNAFRSYIGLTSVTIPGSVTSIGDYAFYEMHQPDQRDDSRQRRQHRGLCVL